MTIETYLDYFELNGRPASLSNGDLAFGSHAVPIREGIPRFTPDMSYSENFSLLREKHAQLQLDSKNGTTDRYVTVMGRTGWPKDFFAGKTVLECGSGAGPDTEILLGLGCKVVAVDLAGVDVAKQNLPQGDSLQLVQASIADLPFKKHSFDIVFCHRVLQHTPNPEQTLAHILSFVKDDGAVFVHSYAHTFLQRFRWKYWLIPFTRRIPPQALYRMVRSYAKALYPITTVTNRFKLGRIFNWFFVPMLNYRHMPQFKNMNDKDMFEYAVHDTFDALSPTYDQPVRSNVMETIASSKLKQPFEIYEGKTITLLRTRIN